MELASIFETMMIICFGISWPLSIVRSYRSRSTKGKSLMFMLLYRFWLCLRHHFQNHDPDV